MRGNPYSAGCTNSALGVRGDVALEATAPAAVLGLATRGLGVAVLSQSMGEAFEGELVTVPVADLPRPGVLALRWSGGGGPAVREFVAVARRCFGR